MSIYTLYVGSFLNSDKAPIYRFEFDSERGTASLREEYNDYRPAWLHAAEGSDRIFFVREAESIGGIYGGGIGCFKGNMQSTALLGIGAAGPCHVCERDGNLFIACYSGSALVQARWLGDGFSPEVRIIHREGGSVNPTRQDRSHPHFSFFTPDGGYLGVCDLGLDKILFYPYSSETGTLGEPILHSAPDGRGPRHAVFSADGRHLYVITEMGGTVLNYEYDGSGGLKLISEHAIMLPHEIDGEPQSAAIRLSPSGKELMATERRTGDMVFFSIDESGELTREGTIPTDNFPRDAVFSPDGKWILTACQGADTVGIYSYSSDTSIPLAERVKIKETLTLPKDSAPCALLFVQ